jgi:hypothetical protein
MHSILEHKIPIKEIKDTSPFVVWQRYQLFRRTRFSYTMNMQTGDSSGKLVTLYWTAGHHIRKHCNFYKPRCRFQNEDNRESNIRVCTVNNEKPSDQLHFFLHDATGPSGPGQPDAETSTRRQTTITRDKHARPRRGSNSQSQQASGRRRPATYKFKTSLLLQKTVSFR